MFGLPVPAPLQDIIAETTPALLMAKFVGALAGSVISVAYVLPRGKREAFVRLGVGVVTGLIFGSAAGVKLADMLGVLDKVSAFEITLIGSASASLCAWWTLGVLERVARQIYRPRYPRPVASQENDKESET